MKSSVKIGPIEAASGRKVSGIMKVGERPGSVLSFPLTVVNGANDGPFVSISAGTHGTEYVGMAAAMDLIGSIDPAKVSGVISIVPVVNVLGFEWRARCTFPAEDDYVGTRNINRLFPGEDDFTLAHRIAWTLFNEIAIKANFVIDMHGGDIFELLNQTCMLYTRGEDEFDRTVVEMARASGQKMCIKIPVERKKGGLVAECIKRKIPAIVIESGDHGLIEEPKVRRAVDAVNNILKHLKVTPGEETPFDTPRFVRETIQIRAKKGGLLRPLVALNSPVSTGDKLCQIQSLDGSIVEVITSPADGFINRWMCNPSVSSGESVVSVGQFYD